ncbi:hypothetical protein JHK85_001275 [Glycine max]|nr:hypothetical protein JHK85_001275 [Glycine max]
MAISLLIFLIGRSTYRYLTPIGSPLTPMLQANLKDSVSFNVLKVIPAGSSSGAKKHCDKYRLRYDPGWKHCQ